MSKPILIVVVVVDIDVVFLKNMLGPKKIWLKKIHVQKNFRQKSFGSKRVRSKKVVFQKNLSKKLRFNKIWGPNKFWVQENVGPDSGDTDF